MARESHIYTMPSTGLRPVVPKADVEVEIDAFPPLKPSSF
jgi:hypothetical protein